MDTTSYEIFFRGKRPGKVLKKTTFRVAYSYTERDGKYYFHLDEDLSDWAEQWAIKVAKVARIVPLPPSEPLPYVSTELPPKS